MRTAGRVALFVGVLSSALAARAVIVADPNAVRPRVVVVLDSSSAMSLTARFYDFGPSTTFGQVIDGVSTHGDGSNEQAGCDVDASNGMTNGRPNDSRLFQAKYAFGRVLKERAFRSVGSPQDDSYGLPIGTPIGVIDFGLASWRKMRGGYTCAAAAGAVCSGAPAVSLRCWDDDSNAGTARVCATRDDSVHFSCSPFSWDEPSASFTCNSTACPATGVPSARSVCTYFSVDQTAHGDVSPFGSTVICPSLASDSLYLMYDVPTCSSGGANVLGPLPTVSGYSTYNEVFDWIDHIESRRSDGSFGNEVRAIGNTPLAASLRDVRTYLASGLDSFAAPLASDCYAGCRPYDVIVISSGVESCETMSSASMAAAQLLGPFTVATNGCNTSSAQVSIRTHVIAFPGCPPGVSDCAVKTQLDLIAQSGGTGSAVIARDMTELEAAMTNIVDSLRTTATVTGSTMVCMNATGGTATSTNATQWGYRTTSAGSVTAIPGATSATYLIDATHFPGPGNYFLVAGNCNFGAVSEEIPITVVASPDATIVAPLNIAPGGSSTASVPTAGSASTYVWTVSGATFAGQGTNSITFTAGMSGVVNLGITVTNGSGCASIDTHTVTISSRVFTDDPLVPASTAIKAVHLEEVREAVNAVRARAGLPPATWADAAVAGLLVKATHIIELRNALEPALAAFGTTPTYTDASLAAGMPVRAAHIQEIREYSR